MKKDLENYAEIILFECLKLKKEEPLFIQAPLERYDFVRIVCNKAYEYGIKDIRDLNSGNLKTLSQFTDDEN